MKSAERNMEGKDSEAQINRDGVLFRTHWGIKAIEPVVMWGLCGVIISSSERALQLRLRSTSGRPERSRLHASKDVLISDWRR